MAISGTYKTEYLDELFEDENAYKVFVVTKASIESPGTFINLNNSNAKEDQEVDAFVCRKSRIAFFPLGLHVQFPAITKIFLSKCGLRMITRFDLHGLEALDTLFLDGNQLGVIPQDLFEDMINLKFVDLSDNKIEFIDSKALLPIKTKLLYLNLKGNKFSGKSLDAEDIDDFLKIVDRRRTIYEEEEPENAMRINGYNTDSKIIVNFNNRVDILNVHRRVLEEKSSVFKVLFKQEDDGKFVIKDYETEIIEQMLTFMYDGKFKKTHEGLTDKKIVKLFKIAKDFEIESMIESLENIVLNEISRFKEKYGKSFRKIFNSKRLKWAAYCEKNSKCS